MSAVDILNKAAGHMQDRASTYDKPEGERSMAQTVAIFNLYHGTELTEAQGWHLLQILKDVRLFTRAGYHADSAEDCVAYAALKAEALHGAAMAAIDPALLGVGGVHELVDCLDEARRQDAEGVTIWPPEERIDVIGRNGNGGEHYAIGCATCHGSGRVNSLHSWGGRVDSLHSWGSCPACRGRSALESRP